MFARMSSLTTPAGRCVASTRWMPRLRPRWAMPTSAGRNAASSAARAANSSMTTTRRGSGGPAGDGPVVGEVGGADRAQQALAPAQLGVEAGQRPFGEAVVEVGHQPDGVRQVGAGVERRPALVVDEHEREVVRAAAGGERDDERAQQLALARAGRAGDEGVGAVADEVDLDDAVGGRGRAARPGAGRARRRATRRRWRWRRRSGRRRGARSSSPSVTETGSAPAAESGSSGSCSPASARATSSPWRSSSRRRARRRRRWRADASGAQRASPIDPISSTLRHIAGTASPGATAVTTATEPRGAEEPAQRPGALGEQVGAVGDDDDVARSVVERPSAAASRSASSAATTPASSPVAACGSHRHQSHRGGSSATTTRRQSAGPAHVASCTTSARTTDAALLAANGEGSAGAEVGRHRHVVEALGGARRSPPARRAGRRPSRRDVPLDRSPTERHAEGVAVLAAARTTRRR